MIDEWDPRSTQALLWKSKRSSTVRKGVEDHEGDREIPRESKNKFRRRGTQLSDREVAEEREKTLDRENHSEVRSR